MSLLQMFYDRAPLAVQNLMVSVDGAIRYRRRYGGDYDAMFCGIRQRETLSREALRLYQAQRLSAMLGAAAATVYWKRQFAEFDVNPAASDPFTELAKLPVLKKSEVQDDAAALSHPAPGEATLTRSTSGTTGAGLVFPATLSSEKHQWGTWWRYRSWHGIDRRVWCGYIAQNPVVPIDRQEPPFHRINSIGRQVIFSPSHLGPQTVKHYLDALRSRRITWLHGFPSNMALLAGLKLEQGLDDLPDLRIVTVGAESLMAHQKRMIREAFNVEVREHYGLAEAVANVSECEHGRLHVDEDYGYVEFLPHDSEPEIYHIIATGFTNLAFPLLRYDTGDLARLSDDACPCGRHWRVVEEIDGRKEDYVVLSTGERIGRLDKVFRSMTTVREAQFEQTALDRVIVRVVPGPGYSEADEAKIIAACRKRFGACMTVEMDHVEHLPRTRAGKVRFVVSRLREGKID